MDNQKEEWALLQELCKEEAFDVTYLSVEFPDGNIYEYQAS